MFELNRLKKQKESIKMSAKFKQLTKADKGIFDDKQPKGETMF